MNEKRSQEFGKLIWTPGILCDHSCADGNELGPWVHDQSGLCKEKLFKNKIETMAKEKESYLIPIQNNFSLTASQNNYRNQKSQGAKYLIYTKIFLLLLYHY